MFILISCITIFEELKQDGKMEILKDIVYSNFWKATTIILLCVIGCGCGSRKVETVKRDSISINNSYQEGSKIVLGNTFTYRPFDSLKPMVIDGKSYKNVIITNDKSKVVEKWKNRYITKTIVSEKEKKSEKKDYTILIIGIIGLILIFLYFKKKPP